MNEIYMCDDNCIIKNDIDDDDENINNSAVCANRGVCDNDVYSFLLQKIKEPSLVQNIVTFSARKMPKLMQNEINLFGFTWNILNIIYIPYAFDTFEKIFGASNTLIPDCLSDNDILWCIYNDLLIIIYEMLTSNYIAWIPLKRNMKKTKTNYSSSLYTNQNNFRRYWTHYVFCCWTSPLGIGCSNIRESLDTNELVNMLKKFLLRIPFFYQIVFLRKIGIESILSELSG